MSITSLVAIGLVAVLVTVLGRLQLSRPDAGRGGGVREIVRTNNAVLISVIQALLDGAGIRHVVLDQNMSVLEGSLGVLPRRLLVPEDDVLAARKLLVDAGLAHELRPDVG